jgi:hypothetical protein
MALVFELSVIYFGLHAGLYCWLARRSRFSTEKGVLLYHVVPFLIVTSAVLGATLVMQPDIALPVAVLFIALHTLYSVTFLEAWALTDGSYSLAMLEALDAARVPRAAIVDELVALGTRKWESRRRNLLERKLVEQQGERFALTARGHRFARFLRVILFLTNQQGRR